LTARAYPTPTAVIPYGPAPQQFGELYLPTGDGPHPVAVLIHGGCWRAEYDLAYLRHLAGALRDEGIAVWSIEFRRIGDAGGGWPGTFLDVSRGVDAVRELAGTHRLDLSRVVLSGHSAGGHLALWAGARHAVPPTSDIATPTPLPVRAVVGLAAITDLPTYASATGCGSAVAPLLGGAPTDQPLRVAAASPSSLRGTAPQVWLVTGEKDPIVPASQAAAFQASHPGESVRVVAVPGVGHFELVAPWSTAFPQVRDAIRRGLGR
ncbi:MAG: alpha/beta hydrolase, partial [Gemmatimonadaceae bacterium]|nr:alpha/beta hydrolase [Gemmatimonadaceae bacterium]